MGRDAPLFYTASGHAWLASLDDELALQMVLRQGIADPDQFGPNAPRSTDELLAYLHRARERGYAWVEETSAIGTSALAAVVRRPQSDEVIGVLSIAAGTEPPYSAGTAIADGGRRVVGGQSRQRAVCLRGYSGRLPHSLLRLFF
jgi:hypothetical protein